MVPACSRGAATPPAVSHEPHRVATAPTVSSSRAADPNAETPVPPAELTMSMCERLVQAAKLDTKPRACWEPCKDGGLLAPPQRLNVRGRTMSGRGERLEPDSTYAQMTPQGCWIPGRTRRIETACQVTRKGNVIELEPTFCLGSQPGRSRYSLATCLAGGWVECELGHLEPGVYLITTERLHKCIQVPGTSIHGSDFVQVPSVMMAPKCGER